jgi:hypothetical protein
MPTIKILEGIRTRNYKQRTPLNATETLTERTIKETKIKSHKLIKHNAQCFFLISFRMIYIWMRTPGQTKDAKNFSTFLYFQL